MAAKRAHLILLWTGAVVLGLGLLGATPISWFLFSRQPEDYPEIVFLFVVVPAGLVLLGTGLVMRARRRRSRK